MARVRSSLVRLTVASDPSALSPSTHRAKDLRQQLPGTRKYLLFIARNYHIHNNMAPYSPTAHIESGWDAINDGGPRSVGSLGLRRSDKSSIAPKKPARTDSDAMSEPLPFKSSHRTQSRAPTISPPAFVRNKGDFVETMKRLDVEDITETEVTEDLSESTDLDVSVSPRKLVPSGNSSVHSAPASVRQYAKPVLDKDQRYASFDSGFGERREARMRRVQRIKSSERVMPSLESQQRAIADRRRGRKPNGTDNRVRQELDTVRNGTSLSIKERMAVFNSSCPNWT